MRGIQPCATLTNATLNFPCSSCSLAACLSATARSIQDIEFTVENGRLYMLQCRNGKRTAKASVKIAVDMVSEGLAFERLVYLR